MRATAVILRLRRISFLKAAARTARAVREQRRADDRLGQQERQADALRQARSRLARAAAESATGRRLHECARHQRLLEEQSQRVERQATQARQVSEQARDAYRIACRAMALETARWRAAAEIDRVRCRGDRQRRERRLEEEADVFGVAPRGVRNPDTVSGKTGHIAGPLPGAL